MEFKFSQCEHITITRGNNCSIKMKKVAAEGANRVVLLHTLESVAFLSGRRSANSPMSQIYIRSKLAAQRGGHLGED